MLFSRITNWYDDPNELKLQSNPNEWLLPEIIDGNGNKATFLLYDASDNYCLCRTDKHMWPPISLYLISDGTLDGLPVYRTTLTTEQIRLIEPTIADMRKIEE